MQYFLKGLLRHLKHLISAWHWGGKNIRAGTDTALAQGATVTNAHCAWPQEI